MCVSYVMSMYVCVSDVCMRDMDVAQCVCVCDVRVFMYVMCLMCVMCMCARCVWALCVCVTCVMCV